MLNINLYLQHIFPTMILSITSLELSSGAERLRSKVKVFWSLGQGHQSVQGGWVIWCMAAPVIFSGMFIMAEDIPSL